MTHAGWALQKAVYSALSDDVDLTALVGDGIHDGAPRASALPYVVFEPLTISNLDGDAAAVSEHELTLAAWSRSASKQDLLSIAERIGAVLHDADLTLDGHLLINLRLEREHIAQQPDRRGWRAEFRFRAVTEPAI